MPRRRAAHPRWALALASVLWGASLACSALAGGAATATPAQATRAATLALTPGGAPTEAPSDTPPTSAPTAAGTTAPLPLSTQPGEVTLEQSLVLGSGTFIYTDTRAGLAALSSYMAQLTVTFAGTRDGQPEQWTTTSLLLAANDPPARQWTIETTGDAPNPGVVFVAEVEGAAYERRGEAACTATAVQDGHALTDRLELAAALTAVIGAEEAGAETINGVPSARYTFDQRALGEEGLTVATGELWVAAEGGYVVQYRLSRQGSAAYFGDGIEGTLTLDYALTSINQPVAITVPGDCPPGLVNAPLLPDAAEVVNVPGLLAYATATSLADAVVFYQEALPGLGWAADGEPAVTDATTILLYTQGKQHLTVIFSAEAVGASVNMVIGDLPE